jgi:hypothetical protein
MEVLRCGRHVVSKPWPCATYGHIRHFQCITWVVLKLFPFCLLDPSVVPPCGWSMCHNIQTVPAEVRDGAAARMGPMFMGGEGRAGVRGMVSNNVGEPQGEGHTGAPGLQDPATLSHWICSFQNSPCCVGSNDIETFVCVTLT